jgi:hypothetical protein
VKLEYNMTSAKCRLTEVAALSMMHTGPKRTVSENVEHSAHDRGVSGGFGGVWTTKTAGIGTKLWEIDGGIPEGLRGLQERV